MSCSLYRWSPDCEDDYCPGDCDLCNKNNEDEEEKEEEE